MRRRAFVSAKTSRRCLGPSRLRSRPSEFCFAWPATPGPRFGPEDMCVGAAGLRALPIVQSGLSDAGYGATVFTVAVMQCAPARAFLGHQKLRALGRLSFPIYLTHWPIIFGASCFIFVASAPWLGMRGARSLAMIAGVAFAVVAAGASSTSTNMPCGFPASCGSKERLSRRRLWRWVLRRIRS